MNLTVKTAIGEVEIATLPEASVAAILSRGFSHFFGSEVASRVKSQKDAKAKEGVVLDEAEVDALRASVVEEFKAKLFEGKIGVRVSAEPVDPLEKEMHRVAKEEVVAVLKANGIKIPKGDETITLAGGVTRTMDEMIARRLEINGEAIEKEAKKRIAAKRKQLEAVKVAEGSEATADALGL